MKEKVTKTIYVGKDAYMYLDAESRKQRGCQPLTEERKERFWDILRKDSRGLVQLSDLSLGGGDGTYTGKWWSWSVDTLKSMLVDGGFTYEEGEPMKYYNGIM